jgi:hypothetical protein
VQKTNVYPNNNNNNNNNNKKNNKVKSKPLELRSRVKNIFLFFGVRSAEQCIRLFQKSDPKPPMLDIPFIRNIMF